MPDPTPDPERLGKNTKQKIDEIEKTVKAILVAIKALEEETGDAYMPVGEYLGVKFDA